MTTKSTLIEPPAKRVFLRNSERSDFTDCRWRWSLSYRDRLRPIEYGMNPLIFGDIIHRSLAGWYIPETSVKKCRRGVHPAHTAERIFDTLENLGRTRQVPIYNGDAKPEWEDAKELAIKMMEAYIDYYGKDEEFQVIYPEMPFQLDIYDHQGRYVVTLVGTTDCLVRRRGGRRQLGLLEHKTAAQISTGHLFTDEQANTYWCVVPMWLRENGIIKPNVDIEFMEYNFMRKAFIDDDRPQNAAGQYLNSPTVAVLKEVLELNGVVPDRKCKKDDLIALCEEKGIAWQQLGTVSSTQPDNLFHRETVYRTKVQREKTMERILQQVREMRLVRAGKLDTFKRPSKNCSWCGYRDLCEMDEMGEDTGDVRKHLFTKWEPYKDHIWSLDLAG